MDFDRAYADRQLARRGSAVRRWVKARYVARVLAHVRGPAVDLGCGAGQILARLPRGSMGVEVNPVLVDTLRAEDLDVVRAVPHPDRVDLDAVPAHRFGTAILSHVLEHFADAAGVLRRLMTDCAARGIGRLVVVVPGAAGYRTDDTHRTFVTLDYLRAHGLLGGADHRVVHRSFFPGDAAAFGRWFAYHELMLVYELGPPDSGDAPAPRTTAQFARFVAVGVLNTAFSYAVYAAFLFAGLDYRVANLLALATGVLFSFRTQSTLVFGGAGRGRLPRFVLAWTTLYAFNVFLIGRFVAVGLDAYAAGALALPFVVACSFVVQKFVVFRPPRSD